VSERYSLEASIERFRESINELVKGPAIDTLSQ